MPKPSTTRRYGKQTKKTQAAGRLFVELPQTPIRSSKGTLVEVDPSDDGAVVEKLAQGLSTIKIQDENSEPAESPLPPRRRTTRQSVSLEPPEDKAIEPRESPSNSRSTPPLECELGEEVVRVPDDSSGEVLVEEEDEVVVEEDEAEENDGKEKDESILFSQDQSKELQILSWAEVCPLGDSITKIAEASYAEVYRVMNERGTSIIKVIRLSSPIKQQTKTQIKSGLVDEEPHGESDLLGELQISEWVADIPGFVVYKERYIVQGKACRELLETHQAFHKKLKRQDPDRLQFYPSPSRYLDDTKFLVVELGDAGTALEDFELTTMEQLWDVFFHVAIALARAETRIEFEHRDLHEGNLCIRKVGEPVPQEERDWTGYFGFSGLEITILDYGLSRAQGDYESEPVAYDLERELGIFTSEHAAQCRVYRQMRSFLLREDRVCIPPDGHKEAYMEGIDGPISWAVYEPYTNVLWLAYLYEWMVGHFRGPKKEVNSFKRATKEMWTHLNPEADESVPGFESASDILRYAVETGWVDEDQLMGEREEIEKSILSILAFDDTEGDAADRSLRRSPRRRRPTAG